MINWFYISLEICSTNFTCTPAHVEVRASLAVHSSHVPVVEVVSLWLFYYLWEVAAVVLA